MKVIIAGGRGLLGTALSAALVRDGHEVVVLTRGSAGGSTAGVRLLRWLPGSRTGSWQAEIDEAGAIVNLAGESIAAGRWSAGRKRQIENRVSS